MVKKQSRSILFFILALFSLTLGSAACTRDKINTDLEVSHMHMAKTHLVTSDGMKLPLKKWSPQREPQAIILALHGFNDYSNAFSKPAEHWTKEGFLVYAYDQRGFGATSDAGMWPETSVLVQDLLATVALLKEIHPKVPLYLLGESMGGALLIAASHRLPTEIISGFILVAPAVWARKTMPPMYVATLWLGAHVIPWLRLSGKGLKIQASDNRQMLLELGEDPLVIKQTRIDTMYGLVNLMDSALRNTPNLATPTLLLYGANDEIIPKHATSEMLTAMNNSPRVVVYPKGYHMLLRDLQADTVLRDITEWIRHPNNDPPSGHGNAWRTFF